MVYVTHDQVEAMTLGDRIVIMKDGYIQQCASPLELYDYPVNKFVGSFIGSPPMNFILGRVEGNGDEMNFIFGDFKLPLTDRIKKKIQPLAGQEVYLGVRPEHAYDAKYVKDGGSTASVHGTIEVIERLGNEILIYLSVAGQKITLKEDAHCKAEIGEKINISFSMNSVHIFDKKTEANHTLK
jgi:multiple sugar transport system ATP-binding protein